MKNTVIVFAILALVACGCSPDHSGDTNAPVPVPQAAKGNPNSVENNPYIPEEAKKKMAEQKAAAGGAPAPGGAAPAPEAGK